MVEQVLAKDQIRVRFPVPAQFLESIRYLTFISLLYKTFLNKHIVDKYVCIVDKRHCLAKASHCRHLEF